MREPLIKYAYDGETGEMYDSKDCFANAQTSAETRNKYSRQQIKPVCCECNQPLAVAMYQYGHGFFKHKPNHSDCVLSKENLSSEETERYNHRAKESYRHKYLKKRIGELLMKEDGVEKDSISVDQFFINDEEEKRKPDVYCVYNGKPLAFEVQLSSLTVGEIWRRNEFYKRNNIYLLWIQDELDPRNQRMLDKDIKRHNEYHNLFQLNEKANTFELTAYYKKPFLHYDTEVYCRWETANISLKKLRFDEDFNVFYFDYPSACNRCNLMVEEELQRRANNEKRNRICNKIEPILIDIRRCHNYNAQNFHDIKVNLNNLDEYEIEVFREEFQKENKRFDNLIPLLDKASDKESAYYQFILSSPEVGIDFSKYKEKTLLMSILGNKELRIGVIIGLFENGYQLSEQDKLYIKETEPTKGVYEYKQLSWLLFWWNNLKNKTLASSLCLYHKQLFTVLSAIKSKPIGLGFKNMVSIANNAVEHYKNCWFIIEKAFRKNTKSWDEIKNAPSFIKKLNEINVNQIATDEHFESLCKELFPEIWE